MFILATDRFGMKFIFLCSSPSVPVPPDELNLTAEESLSHSGRHSSLVRVEVTENEMSERTGKITRVRCLMCATL